MKVIKTATCFGSVKQASSAFVYRTPEIKPGDGCFTLPKHVAVLITLKKALYKDRL